MQYFFFKKPNFTSKWPIIYNKQGGICRKKKTIYPAAWTPWMMPVQLPPLFVLWYWTNLSSVQTESKMELKDWHWPLYPFKYMLQSSLHLIKQPQCPTLIEWWCPRSESGVRLLPWGEHIVEDCRGEKHILKPLFFFFFVEKLFSKNLLLGIKHFFYNFETAGYE